MWTSGRRRGHEREESEHEHERMWRGTALDGAERIQNDLLTPKMDST